MPSFEYEGRTIHLCGKYGRNYECINQGIFYEQPFLEAVRDMGLKGTYLDIGTNAGLLAVYFGLFCDVDRVIGFEPVSHWRRRALKNIELNGLKDRIQVLGHGLLDVETEIPFDQAGAGTLLSCKRLDDVLPNLMGVSFVKMDIEGSEPKALIGGKKFFQRNRPVIAAEVLEGCDEIFRAAESIGYKHSGRIFPSTPSSPMYEFLPI